MRSNKCVAAVTVAETVDNGSGGSVEDDVCAVVEVVQVVTTIEAPKTEHVIQNQVLQTEETEETGKQEDRQTERERETGSETGIPRPVSSSWRRCSSGVSLGEVLLDSLEA